MAGLTTQVRRYLTGLYGYWRDIIITCLGALFLIAGLLVLYPVFWYVPPALRYLLMVVLPLSFVVLAMITWSLLPDSFLVEFGGGYPYESIQWLDLRIIHEKYTNYLFFGIAANVLYFLGLGVYFFSLGDRMKQVLSSESAGIPILFSWMILNCAVVIASCAIIYLSEPSPRILPTLAPLVPGLGQVMNGEAIKGKIFLLGVFLGFFLHHILSIMVALAIWLYSLYDAYEASGTHADDAQQLKGASDDGVIVHILIVLLLGAIVWGRWFIL